MKVNFNESSHTVLEGLGLTPERFLELKDSFGVSDGKNLNKLIKDILESDNEKATMAEKIGLMFEIGANFGQVVMARELQANAEEAMLRAATVANGGKLDA